MQYIFLTKYNGAFLGPIAKVLGYILDGIYFILSQIGIENVGICIIFFTFIVNGLMIPLTIKQQKYSKLSAKMSPELTKIQAKYKGKRDEASIRASQLETQAIYEKYGTSPTGGCLPMLITFPIMLALYKVMYNIPAYVAPIKGIYESVAHALQNTGGVEKLATFVVGQENAIENAVAVTTKGWGDVAAAFAPGAANSTNHIIDVLSQFRPSHWEILENTFPAASDIIVTASDKVAHINTFLGLNITDRPQLLAISVIIPILAVATQMLQTKLMMPASSQNAGTDTTAQTMKTMNTVMPLISGVFCLMMPMGVGLYWISNSVFRIVQQIFVDKYLDRISIDELIEKNVMKARAKKEKRGIDPDAAMKQVAALRTSSINEKPATTTKSVKKSQAPSDYKKGQLNYQKGSISSIANVLGNGKNNSEKGE